MASGGRIQVSIPPGMHENLVNSQEKIMKKLVEDFSCDYFLSKF